MPALIAVHPSVLLHKRIALSMVSERTIQNMLFLSPINHTTMAWVKHETFSFCIVLYSFELLC